MSRLAPAALLVAALVLTGACSDDEPGRDATDDTRDVVATTTAPMSVFDARPGDCLRGDGAASATVPCDEPHTQEVFAVPTYPGNATGTYPGDDAIRAFADDACLTALDDYTGTDYLDAGLYFSYLHPTAEHWAAAETHVVVCVIVATGGKELTGSARATGR